MPQDFNRQYRIALRRVRRVYPLVLEAARIIDSLDQELESIEKNRKKKKLMRKTHKALKDDFKYLLKDLYISEGKVLTKLIHRETGMTVAEIIKKYKNGFQSSLYTGLAGFFDQELDVKYKPNTDDFVLECVVQDILQGNVDFDPDFEKIDKEQHKINQKEYRAQKKKTRKRLRKQKREKRKEKREKRKSQK
ncbi:hypothetical protein CW751_05885 [Brumimicrobium salinarum]|uniref:DUF4294 domain-containing protein n=2 Tax=Brumimicrobium salinarum TaxID=2058658 RepID=A0A2I0R3G2_9FLAO|nr:hypothetical protein CW751_05885 [Brumimicrobium salinarum]